MLFLRSLARKKKKNLSINGGLFLAPQFLIENKFRNNATAFSWRWLNATDEQNI